MKKITTYIFLFSFIIALNSTDVWAGNKDRAGQAGAIELLMNPWGISSGFHGMNTATTRGLESMRLNAGGLAHVEKTEVVFANSQWLKGSEITLNAFGLAQRLGEDGGVLGLNIVSVGLGEIPVTTVDAPEGTSGATFSPSLLNIGLSYARSFSSSIHVGFLLRLINESISNASATGVALDMGIQYVTGPTDNIKFGIALRNIGTPMSFAGDGLSYRTQTDGGAPYNLTVSQRSERFELPTILNIGIGYDFNISERHRVTAIANFTSNSFGKDNFGGGLEYAFNEMFMIRAGYKFEDGLTGGLSIEERTSVYTGLAVGTSVLVPLKKDSSTKIGIDYSYRTTNPYAGTHTIGVRFNL